MHLSNKPLVIGERLFRSRLILGTGKFSSPEAMRRALAASGTEMVTVALRRADLTGRKDPFANILEFVDSEKYLLLPNTSGAMNAEEAVRLARLAVAAGRAQDTNRGNRSEAVFYCGIIYIHVYTCPMKHLNPTQILQQISQIQRMEPGKLCVIRQGPNGPYYNLQCREQGKTLTRYVPPDQVEVLSQHTANYQKFQELVGQYAQLIIEQTRAERTAGLKKKTSRPRSSWPKTRRSNN